MRNDKSQRQGNSTRPIRRGELSYRRNDTHPRKRTLWFLRHRRQSRHQTPIPNHIRLQRRTCRCHCRHRQHHRLLWLYRQEQQSRHQAPVRICIHLQRRLCCCKEIRPLWTNRPQRKGSLHVQVSRTDAYARRPLLCCRRHL